ncbi:unnamed protein product [Amoebophrya sp. A120]|nr:unnamed protein product [Amoebophrya sp. A120]|eukprot:GSA120T00013389001.1
MTQLQASSGFSDDDWGAFESSPPVHRGEVLQPQPGSTSSGPGGATSSSSSTSARKMQPPAVLKVDNGTLDALFYNEHQHSRGKISNSAGPLDELLDHDHSGRGSSTAKMIPGGGAGVRQMNEAATVLEDHEKHTITVYYKGEKNIVTWYADGTMSKRDIQEAILCACDAIIDGGFVLREMQMKHADGSQKCMTKNHTSETITTVDDLLGDHDGPTTQTTSHQAASGSTPGAADSTTSANNDDESQFTLTDQILEWEQFDQLKHNSVYLLQPGKERKELENITGDRWRRLKIQIDPILHVEAQKAIARMKRGSNLLKHTRYGYPHLRMFQLSEDTRRLIWYSAAKEKKDTVISMENISEILIGNGNDTSNAYKLAMLEHLSFTIVCKNPGAQMYSGTSALSNVLNTVTGAGSVKSLEVTCKDEFEFDHWVTGLKALHYHHTSRLLSKEQLLNHSQRFKRALQKNNVAIKLTQLPEIREKGHVGLDDCIEISVSQSKEELEQKLDRLKERHKTLQLSTNKLDFHAEAETELDLAVMTGSGPAYAALFTDTENCEDEEMEYRRMQELLKEVQSQLTKARNDFIAIKEAQLPGTQNLSDAIAGTTSSGNNKEEGSTSATRNSKKNKPSQLTKQEKEEQQKYKNLDHLLWKIEVDLENVEDILSRYLDNQKQVQQPWQVLVQEKTAEFTRNVNDNLQIMQGKVDEWRKWWNK